MQPRILLIEDDPGTASALKKVLQAEGYATDLADNERNRSALVGFARGADLLFIEAVFLEIDRQHAERKAHLTARAAGEIAKAAGVKTAVPFHFSPRYLGRETELRREFAEAWLGSAAS